MVMISDFPNSDPTSYFFCLLSPELLLVVPKSESSLQRCRMFGFQLKTKVALWGQVWQTQFVTIPEERYPSRTATFIRIAPHVISSPSERLQLSFVCEEKVPIETYLQKKSPNDLRAKGDR